MAERLSELRKSSLDLAQCLPSHFLRVDRDRIVLEATRQVIGNISRKVSEAA